jgi:hypothetical protein
MPKTTNPLRSFTAKRAKRSKQNEPIQLSSVETEVLLMCLLGLVLNSKGWIAFQTPNHVAPPAIVKALWELGLLDCNFTDTRVFDCPDENIGYEALKTASGPPLLLVWANQRAAEVLHGSSATTKKAVH